MSTAETLLRILWLILETLGPEIVQGKVDEYRASKAAARASVAARLGPPPGDET